LSPK
jgi:transcriptional antiterminator RfaH